MGGGIMAPALSAINVPYTPSDKSLWHDGIYDFYSLCEVALGLRKEVTEEDKAYAAAEEALKSGKRDWYKNIDSDFDIGIIDEIAGRANAHDEMNENAGFEAEETLGMVSADDFFRQLQEHKDYINDNGE